MVEDSVISDSVWGECKKTSLLYIGGEEGDDGGKNERGRARVRSDLGVE